MAGLLGQQRAPGGMLGDPRDFGMRGMLGPTGLRPGSSPMSPMQSAGQQYPILKNLNMGVINTPMPGDNRMLEFWPPDEPGDAQFPRPKQFPLGKPGVQVISPETKPSDIAGDVVSHYLVNTDPKLKGMYDQFAQSFQTPEAQARLREDYKWARANEGEKRPFDEWATTTRIPDYFRGYVFKQWPEKAYGEMYSPDQRGLLDQMSSYIGGTGEAPQ